MFKRTKGTAIVTHILFVLLFLVVPVIVFPRLPDESFFALSKPLIHDMLANSLILGFFYLNYYLFITRFYFNRKYVVYILCILLSLVVAFELPYIITDHLLLFKRPVPEPGFQHHGPGGPPLPNGRP